MSEDDFQDWLDRDAEDRITLAAFRKYARRAFDAGYAAGELSGRLAGYDTGYAVGRLDEREFPEAWPPMVPRPDDTAETQNAEHEPQKGPNAENDGGAKGPPGFAPHA